MSNNFNNLISLLEEKFAFIVLLLLLIYVIYYNIHNSIKQIYSNIYVFTLLKNLPYKRDNIRIILYSKSLIGYQ